MTNNLTKGKTISSPMVNNTDFDEGSKSQILAWENHVENPDWQKFLIDISNPGFDQGPTQTTILIPNEQFRTANQNGGAKQAVAGCGFMLTVLIFIYNCWVVGYNASH